MKIKECMTCGPATCAPITPLRLVAQLMAAHDCSAIPVSWSGTLVGIITDRDIACRAVACGVDCPDRPVAEFMTAPVVTIAPDDDVETAVYLMQANHVHHLPVIGANGELLGIVAQSDLGRRLTNREFGALARSISIKRDTSPFGQHELVRRSDNA